MGSIILPVTRVTFIYFRNPYECTSKEYHQTYIMINASATIQYLVSKEYERY